MEDTNEVIETGAAAGPNRTVLIMVGVIVVLLAAVVAIMLLGGKDDAAQPTDQAAPTGGQTGTQAGGVTPTGEPTKVAAGQTPEQHVSAYFDAVIAKDYTTAFELQPAGYRENRTVESYSADVAGYAISAYEIAGVTEQGGNTVVTAMVTTGGMGVVQYDWVFQPDGDGWICLDRNLVF